MSLGRSESDSAIRAVESGQFANEAAFLIYTSGTTGHPKGKRKYKKYDQQTNFLLDTVTR